MRKRKLVTLTPERRLVGRIAGADWSVGARRTWDAALFAGIDWRGFAGLAARHKIRPMAATALQETGWPGVPAPIREKLENAVRTCTFRTAGQLRTQQAIATAASAAGLRFFGLKGLVLSTRLYGDPLIREAFDFDLLVPPGDLKAFREILRGQLFEPAMARPELTPRQTAILARYFHEEKLFHRESDAVIDLHHALTANPWRSGSGFEELWRRRQSIRIGASEVALPGDTDLMRYLIGHASGHAWDRWKWIGDIAALCRSLGPSAVAEQRRAARDDGWLTLFDAALLLSHEVTGWTPDPALIDAAKGNPAARRLAERSLRFSTAGKTEPIAPDRIYMLRQALFRLRLIDDPRHLRHELAHLMHRPIDWYELRLPDSLIPAYYVLRPFLFLKRRLSFSKPGQSGT